MLDKNQQSGHMLTISCLVKTECKEYFFETVDLLTFSFNKDSDIMFLITLCRILIHCPFLSVCIYILTFFPQFFHSLFLRELSACDRCQIYYSSTRD